MEKDDDGAWKPGQSLTEDLDKRGLPDHAALGKWCEELYAEKQKANADVPWLAKSAEELEVNPPRFRWPHARKPELRAGIEPDSEKNVQLTRSHEDEVTLALMRKAQRLHGPNAWASVRGGRYTAITMGRPHEL